MSRVKIIAALAPAGSLSACDASGESGGGHVATDQTIDQGQGGGQKDLSALVAGSWGGLNGGDHRIIADALEDDLSQQLDLYGKSVRSGTALPTTATEPCESHQMISNLA